jgi:FdhD protein
MTARPGSTVRRTVEQVSFDGGEAARRTRTDVLATEEPLEIRIVRADDARGRRVLSDRAHRVSVTMRTPGADFELAAGFLFAEGLIGAGADIGTISYCGDAEQRYNVVNVVLAPGVAFDPAQLARNFFATSSCGVCGKASIEAVTGPACPRIVSDVSITPETLLSLPGKLRPSQAVFERTGGLHAAALFDADGGLLRVREDVGRHNAMDKLVGGALLAGEVPLADRVVLVSGRLSFELVQKAARAGVAVLAAVSAPSSLAVELAEQAGMTLVGFLREARFNVYAGAERIAAPASIRNGR